MDNDIFDLFNDILDGMSFEHPKTHSIYEMSTGISVSCKYCGATSNWILVNDRFAKRYECHHEGNIDVDRISFWSVYSNDVDNGLEGV
ncbi:MAG: hypothetical protein HC874_31905 [Richelia sp. SL_2_1]|nr:hypothetical protein [Richelia sp. SL_2_1]